MKNLIIVLALFLLFSPPIFATTSFLPLKYSDTDPNSASCSGFTFDGTQSPSPYTWDSRATPWYFCAPQFADFEVPDGSTVNNIYLSSSGTVYGTQDDPSFKYRACDSSNYCEPSGSGGTSTRLTNSNFNSGGSTTPHSQVLSSSELTDWQNGQKLALQIQRYSYGTISGSTTAFGLSVDYTEPSVSLATSSATLDKQNSSIGISFNGSFAYYYSDMQCVIDVYEKWQSNLSPEPVSTVRYNFWDRANFAVTRHVGGLLYLGRLDSSPSDDKDYYADDLKVPIRDWGTIEYPLSSYCERVTYNEYGIPVSRGAKFDIRQGVSSTLDPDNYDPTYKLSPLNTVNLEAPILPDCDADLICDFKNWLSSFFAWQFLPSRARVENNLVEAREIFKTHAPFAYIYPIFEIDTSYEAGDSDISLPFVYDGVTYDIDITGNETWVPVLALIKQISTLVIVGIFVIYLFNASRRILQ